MIPTTTITNAANRKRSRRSLQQQGQSSVTMSSVFLTLTMLFAISQASALDASSTSLRKTAEIPNASMEAGKIERFDYESEHGSDDFEEKVEDEIDVKDDQDLDKDVNHWTPEEHLLMDHLYNRYIEDIVEKYGADWEEEYEIDVDRVGLYEEYLEFERQEKSMREKKRELTQASHNVLLEYDGSITDENKDCINIDPQNRTQEQSSGVRGSMQECYTSTPTPTTIITTRSGNIRNTIAAI